MQQDLLDLVFLNREPSQKPDDPPAPAAMADAAGPSSSSSGADKCPVDHKSREAWLAQARAAAAAAPEAQSAAVAQPQPQSQPSSSSSGWNWRLPSLWSSSPPSPAPQAPPSGAATSLPASPVHGGLGSQREISSIPRSSTPGPSSCPVNHETETGADPATGNWIYPSEKMFFEAMRRKGHGAQAADMRTVVPIHNAVNERAWAEIKEWERPYSGENTSCPGGPRLHSFTGLSGHMSPKARINTLLGYTEPFDRHDWVVDRCGTTIEYVIDFYAGSSRSASPGKVNFYLDVRPKLNSWEGVKMRASRALGLV